MKRGSWIDISASALAHNHAFLEQHLAPSRIVWVVKGNAYGHGIEQIIPLAEGQGANYFGVFTAQEAERLLQAAQNRPRILIMGQIEDDELEWAVHNDVECYIFDAERLKAALQAAQRVGKAAKLHLEVETGMNRTGMERDELRLALGLLEQHREHAELVGFCTHYAGAESVTNYLRVQKQYKMFRRYCHRMRDAGWSFEFHHGACSAAAMR
jgi:alanine racemase